MSRAFIPPETCPVCGDAVPRTAKACPGCGADERSGWDEETARYDGLDLPAAAFETDTPRPPRRTKFGKLWLLVAIILLLALIFPVIFR